MTCLVKRHLLRFALLTVDEDSGKCLGFMLFSLLLPERKIVSNINHQSQKLNSTLCRLLLPKNSADLENGSSRGFPIIVVEHPAQFIAAADAAHLEEARRRLDQFVLDSLMIAPLAIVVNEGRDGGPQMSFAQEDQATQACLLN